MRFEQFQQFLECLYMKEFEIQTDAIKRKLLSLKFKIQRHQNKEGSNGKERPGTESLSLLTSEKQDLKQKLKEIDRKGLEINQVYMKMREDLKMDDHSGVSSNSENDCVIQFYEKMRGYVPEYEKLPKILKLPASKATSPQRMEDELVAASKGVPKSPEFLQLQMMLRKNKEQETQIIS